VNLGTCLVTGGAGFIGSHIVEALVREKASVRVLDNFSTGKRENLEAVAHDIELVEGDIRDVDTCYDATEGVNVVLHQAAIASVPQSVSNPFLTNEVNIGGTLNMLIAARDAGARSFVLASSSAVYGDSANVPHREGSEGAPLSPYAVSKLAAEAYCRMFSALYGLPTVSLRYFNVFGPRQNPASSYAAVIPAFIGQLMAGAPPVIYGDGGQSRDFVYVEDVARANILAAKSGLTDEVLNVASGSETSLSELADTLGRVMGVARKPEHGPARKATPVYRRLAEVSKAERLLGFRTQVSLEAGLRQLVHWWSQECAAQMAAARA